MPTYPQAMPRYRINLMGAREIEKRLGVSRQRVYQLTTHRNFPEPVAELAMGKVWLTEDVERWIKQYRPGQDDDD